jgi:hypothetical protein
MYLGFWSNVYMVDETTLPPLEVMGKPLPGALGAIGHRPQFAGQFWIGIAAWPAIWQYANYDQNARTGPLLGNYQRMPQKEDFLNDLQRNTDKTWDLAWVYTVIAGVLNILVIYDAFAGPAFLPGEEPTPTRVRQETQPA